MSDEYLYRIAYDRPEGAVQARKGDGSGPRIYLKLATARSALGNMWRGRPGYKIQRAKVEWEDCD